jgi:hypothetical protein
VEATSESCYKQDEELVGKKRSPEAVP